MRLIGSWVIVVAVVGLPATSAAQTHAAQGPPAADASLSSTVQTLVRTIASQQKLLEEQGRQLEQLRREMAEMRGLAPASPRASVPIVQEQSPVPLAPAAQLPPIEQTPARRPELPPDLVSAADFPGSFKIPGSDAALKIGGMVRVNWVSTFDPLNIQDRFETSAIPVGGSSSAAEGGSVDVIASPSRFNFDLRTPTGVGYMRAFIEGDFGGTKNTLRLRHAYGQWRPLIFGQTWSTFADPEAEPDMIDFEGLNAIVRFRQAQIRWSFPLSERSHRSDQGPDLPARAPFGDASDETINGESHVVADTATGSRHRGVVGHAHQQERSALVCGADTDRQYVQVLVSISRRDSDRGSTAVGRKGETVMYRQLRILGGIALLGAALVMAMPLGAQQPPAAAGTPTEAPTKEAPLRFTAFNVSMPTGQAGVTEITIERWTTADERTALLGLVATAKEGEGGQRKLLAALQKIKPRTGFIRTPNSIGWDLRYAVENKMDDGTRQIVIATDKPVSFGAAAGGSEVLDYPFTLIEMRMKPNEKGEGKMLAAASILTKNGRLELENYGQEPVRLTSITEEEKKKR